MSHVLHPCLHHVQAEKAKKKKKSAKDEPVSVREMSMNLYVDVMSCNVMCAVVCSLFIPSSHRVPC